MIHLKLYVCDYQLPRSSDVDSIIIEAEDMSEAEMKSIQELKSLEIPKRYIINITEVL